MSRRPPARVSVLSSGGLELLVIEVTPDCAAADALEGPRPGLSELTAAEREVALLAIQGLDNATIAARRRTSVSTVANQLGRVYAKLGIASRAELVLRWSVARAE
jgi:DNA-binding CsgD family transcriptional regulator